jgi:uncharacterized protein
MLNLDQHRAERLAALEAEDGWLNLTDRVELSTAKVSVGSGEGVDLRLSCGPAVLGILDPVARTLTTEGKSLTFAASAGGFDQLRAGGLLLELHVVDGQTALRVRDLSKPRKADLRYFPTNPAWVIKARWQALTMPIAKEIGQKGGGATSVQLTHTAHFTHDGQEVTLLATHWKGDKPMFVIRDQTSGTDTYAASRFLIGEDTTQDQITLDFNRAFTPPCGYSDFAICPLPPRENILPFRIEAGELSPA